MENLQFLLSGFSVLFTGQNILIACLGAIPVSYTHLMLVTDVKNINLKY